MFPVLLVCCYREAALTLPCGCAPCMLLQESSAYLTMRMCSLYAVTGKQRLPHHADTELADRDAEKHLREGRYVSSALSACSLTVQSHDPTGKPARFCVQAHLATCLQACITHVLHRLVLFWCVF
eukprot:1145090-Pelagomonas_calceolata.AAC.1